MHILVADDDLPSVKLTSFLLEEAGYRVFKAYDGPSILQVIEQYNPDLVLLDVSMPKSNGFDICRQIRRTSDVPIIFLSARSQLQDRVMGLQIGGDDYLVKPFAFSELLARLEALARRSGSDAETATQLRVADLEMDLLRRTVNRAGRTIELQPREFRLLEYLMRRHGQVVTRTMLLEGVWDYHFDPQTNVIDVHISRLRAKIDKGYDQPLLHTVRGAGYSLRAPD